MSSLYSIGNNINKTKTLQYNALYNNNFLPESKSFICSCENQVNNNTGTPLINPSQNISNAQRVSNILINYTSYGQTQYANASLGNVRHVNYLGKTEGQKGGSGAPPKNRLR